MKDWRRTGEAPDAGKAELAGLAGTSSTSTKLCTLVAAEVVVRTLSPTRGCAGAPSSLGASADDTGALPSESSPARYCSCTHRASLLPARRERVGVSTSLCGGSANVNAARRPERAPPSLISSLRGAAMESRGSAGGSFRAVQKDWGNARRAA